ncbi:MAG: hypothetical protein WD645_03895 [Dehalococcoidia bacterium]
MGLDLRLKIDDPEVVAALREMAQKDFHSVHGAQAMVVRIAVKEYLANKGYLEEHKNAA